MKDATIIDKLAILLVIIGGLNWGLVGLLNMNLVEMLLGTIPVLVQIIYILVGLAALYSIYMVLSKK